MKIQETKRRLASFGFNSKFYQKMVVWPNFLGEKLYLLKSTPFLTRSPPGVAPSLLKEKKNWSSNFLLLLLCPISISVGNKGSNFWIEILLLLMCYIDMPVTNNDVPGISGKVCWCPVGIFLDNLVANFLYDILVL